MCTITVLRNADGLRLACNRDESRLRPAAHPPRVVTAGTLQAVLPLDPQGGGTWIGANSAGLVFALLNAHDEPARTGGSRSRGLIIPWLLDCETPAAAVARIGRVRVSDFAPFRLLAASERLVLELAPRDARLVTTARLLDRPLLFTSSSLGDAVVSGPRRLLFDQMFATPWDAAAQQDAYHAHRWRDRPAVSVHMSRPEACTVSTTVVEVTGREVRMFYAPTEGGTPAGLVIDRNRAPRTAGEPFATALAS